MKSCLEGNVVETSLQSPTDINRWFDRNPGARDDIFLATKFGNMRDATTGKMSICNKPEYIRQQCDRSLKRLRTDHIDLYYMHRADKTQPIEITVQAMKELQDAGKVRYLGLSEISANTLRRACKVAHIDAVQVEYSPFSLDIEQLGLMSACRELGVAIVAYAPLGKGLLTGSIRSLSDLALEDTRRLFPRFSEENFHKNVELVDKLKEIADRKGCTSTQLVLSWLVRNDSAVFPIPGTTRTANFDENMGALNVEMTDEDDKKIREAVSSAGVAGDRYPAFLVGDLFADTVTMGEYRQ